MPTNLAIDDRLIEKADEYIQRRKQQEVLPLFGMIGYDERYDYKRERSKKRA